MMTYRYCELAAGRNLPVRADGISWSTITTVIPINSQGEEILVATPHEDMRLWNKKVIDFRIDGDTLYAMLKEGQV